MLQAGRTGEALGTLQQLQAAAGLDSPEALHQLGQLFRAGLQQQQQQPGQVEARQLAGLRKHLKPLAGVPAGELDDLEAALPGGHAWLGWVSVLLDWHGAVIQQLEPLWLCWVMSQGVWMLPRQMMPHRILQP